ncbi:DnaA regulatory inactivator Hda [Pseudohalioglobus sediminis]|uniref:DnaA regulatory inactivator Hda n=1 Tax=Pseudohalioglobus sediminis TaxID=2606449 RepID=A0A5B0X0K2_9GAMM|nr:DnaA regulatory inactivator Hda [Pseudohalioglobus sediminis]KAA1192852.1 DnaA regulatory inactivator Hda [Pseudohalioglobus sediminis]
MPTRFRQLPLLVQLRDDATFDNFMASEATDPLLSVLQEQCAGAGESAVFIHGAQGAGKSHLLQACCHRSGEGAMYVPLAELAAYPPQEVLSGVEALDLVALDDVDAVLGQESWEVALFDLYNRARQRGCRLVIAADGAPRTLAVNLPDLRSRLSWGGVFHLPSPSDHEKQAILRFRAARRGLDLSAEVAGFIVTRAPRGLTQLLELLDRLDHASLEQKRGLSIPFVKKVLTW